MSTSNQFEAWVEKIHTREEVIKVFERYATDFTVVSEQFDEYGPVLCDIEIAGDVPGETIQYQYMRRGDFVGQPKRSETTVHRVVYDGAIPVTGYNVTKYNYGTGQWEEQSNPPEFLTRPTV